MSKPIIFLAVHQFLMVSIHDAGNTGTWHASNDSPPALLGTHCECRVLDDPLLPEPSVGVFQPSALGLPLFQVLILQVISSSLMGLYAIFMLTASKFIVLAPISTLQSRISNFFRVCPKVSGTRFLISNPPEKSLMFSVFAFAVKGTPTHPSFSYLTATHNKSANHDLKVYPASHHWLTPLPGLPYPKPHSFLV